MRSVLALMIVAACDSGAPPAASRPADKRAHEQPVVVPAIDAAAPAPDPDPVPAEHAPPKVARRPPTKGWLDTPAWPKGATELELVWLVSTELVSNPKDGDMPLQPLDLIATIGGVSRDAVLEPQFGRLSPLNQPLCASKGQINAYPLEKNEVAKITFYEGGAGGYFVRRKGAGVLEIDTWSQTDGACESHGKMTVCPRQEAAALRMHVPANVKIHEAIYEVDAKGKRTPFDCT